MQIATGVDDADFILAHGTEALGLPSGDATPMCLEDLEKILELCANRKIPMVVANPDYVTVEVRALRVMPGMIGTSSCITCCVPMLKFPVLIIDTNTLRACLARLTCCFYLAVKPFSLSRIWGHKSSFSFHGKMLYYCFSEQRSCFKSHQLHFR